MSLKHIGRGPKAQIATAVTEGKLTSGDIIITNDGNELVLIERDNSQVFVGVGSVKNPTYDADTRKITLPVLQDSGEYTNVEINLGKDMVVTAGTFNTDTQEIELTLTDGSVVKIPAADLVDVYTGSEAATANVVVNDDNTISVTVNKSTTATGNLLKSDDTGLYVSENDFVATKQLIANEATARTEKIGDIGEKTVKEYVDEVTASAAEGASTSWVDFGAEG